MKSPEMNKPALNLFRYNETYKGPFVKKSECFSNWQNHEVTKGNRTHQAQW
jgi:hypothetical protein